MTDRQRPWPAIDEIRAVSQPAHIRNRRNAEHWTADLFTRSISVYLTRLCVWAGISANTVTVVMILSGWLAAGALFLPGMWGPSLALVMTLMQMVLDSIDGEVARWNRATSPRGIFLDRIAHTTTESFIPLALGLSLVVHERPWDWQWAAVGGLMATLVLVNKSLNDAARLARAESGLALLQDTPGGRPLRPGPIRTLRRAADFVPLHRMYHSVEQTIVVFVLALVGAVLDFNGEAVALVLLAGSLPFVITGHTVGILASAALRKPVQ